MLHSRMPVEETASLENRLKTKPVLHKLSLWTDNSLSCWRQEGHGSLDVSFETVPEASSDTSSSAVSGASFRAPAITNEAILRLEAPARGERWPEGSPADGDYCDFGALHALLLPQVKDWRPYNRLHFQIYSHCQGMHSPLIALQLYNDGKEKIPDKYCREGYHTIHLKNGVWNDCIWEFPSLPRDSVTALDFIVHSYGKELSMDDTLLFYLKDIKLEYTDSPENTLGWQCQDKTAVYSTEGYWADGKKTALSSTQTECFEVCCLDTGETAYAGVPLPVKNEKGAFFIWDFSAVKQEGSYYIKSGSFKSSAFKIEPHPLYQSVWKVLNFLYCERCGTPVLGGHGACHGDILARHNNVSLAYCGGWHDAGDVSQQTLQTGEVVHSLLEMAGRIKEAEPALYYRLMEEAAWGLDFVLRMRFGDGNRASSAGIRRWSNGLIGDMDDCDARVHAHAFENFLLSGVEAYAATAFKELDPALSYKAYSAACEDYAFALKRFEEKGMELPSFYEHTYHSSLSQYYAAASFSASAIYRFGGESRYGEYAASFASGMLSCQETDTPDCPIHGFFYREPDKKAIVHFNHQAREQIFMQALEALCTTQPEHTDKPLWESSMRLYGDYLKKIYAYAAPYGLLPAGIHKMDEYQDKKTFELLHLMTTFDEDSPNYKAQLEKGISLTKDYCLRMFPVWFSFRGNTAVHLSAGKAASILGRYFHDRELTEIAREQLYWSFGKNPFGQSLVYGAGSNYAQQYGALNGEMAGSIPVGIETRGNDDIPFWPMENCATYKEVWTTSAGRWLWVAADLY